MTTSRSKIIFIDDEPDSVSSLAGLLGNNANVSVLEPSDVTDAELNSADLVLVDFALGEWAEKKSVKALTLRPEDGLAVVEILRSALRQSDANKPVAFAVLTGALSSLTNPFPPDLREHMVARSTNLEWAFQKNTPAEKLTQQFLELAHAIKNLPEVWPSDSASDKDSVLKDLLDITDERTWANIALGDVLKCHPPIRELSTWTHGLAFIRWLLQRILPYPCFLLDGRYAAARLRITYESFAKCLAARGKSG